jgi:glycosyltransferase involved in cell wall biosynthesis
VDVRGGLAAAAPPSIFFLYRDSPLRRASLHAEPGSAQRYWLFGADQLAARGFAVDHSLEARFAPRKRHATADRALRRIVDLAGGYGGDFATVLACRRAANASDVVVSTVDTVGIPLALLAAAGVARAPFVYTSIGLLERIERLRGDRVRRFYHRAIGRAEAVVAYGYAEAEALRGWLAGLPAPPPVSFVPFGVDTTHFQSGQRTADVDVVSVGADPQRDYELLARVASRFPERDFLVVADADRARMLARAPQNVTITAGVPFDAVRELLAAGRVVALPVRDNLYSGATTTLLQAMALARPVVVTRTAAIADGYGLVDGETCRLVPPGDDAAFERALRELLDRPEEAAALGARAREHVVRELSWERYVDALETIVREAAARRGQDTANR